MAGGKPKKLGRGLNALLGAARNKTVDADNGENSPPQATPVVAGEPLMVPLDAIHPNRKQPRTEFNQEKLNELAASIQSQGVLQPIVVRRDGNGYELIAGERRLRASKLAGRTEIPVIVQALNDDRMLIAALVENIQRDDLNPLEVATAMQMMLDEMGLKHDEVASELGLSRANVSNLLRLLTLSPAVKEAIVKGEITPAHARILAGLPSFGDMDAYLTRVLQEGMTVRQLETAMRLAIEESAPAELVARQKRQEAKAALEAPVSTPKAAPSDHEPRRKPAYVEDLESRFREFLGTKVSISDHQGRGSITIEYYSPEDFSRITNLIGLEERL